MGEKLVDLRWVFPIKGVESRTRSSTPTPAKYRLMSLSDLTRTPSTQERRFCGGVGSNRVLPDSEMFSSRVADRLCCCG